MSHVDVVCHFHSFHRNGQLIPIEVGFACVFNERSTVFLLETANKMEWNSASIYSAQNIHGIIRQIPKSKCTRYQEIQKHVEDLRLSQNNCVFGVKGTSQEQIFKKLFSECRVVNIEDCYPMIPRLSSIQVNGILPPIHSNVHTKYGVCAEISAFKIAKIIYENLSE